VVSARAGARHALTLSSVAGPPSAVWSVSGVWSRLRGSGPSPGSGPSARFVHKWTAAGADWISGRTAQRRRRPSPRLSFSAVDRGRAEQVRRRRRRPGGRPFVGQQQPQAGPRWPSFPRDQGQRRPRPGRRQARGYAGDAATPAPPTSRPRRRGRRHPSAAEQVSSAGGRLVRVTVQRVGRTAAHRTIPGVCRRTGRPASRTREKQRGEPPRRLIAPEIRATAAVSCPGPPAASYEQIRTAVDRPPSASRHPYRSPVSTSAAGDRRRSASTGAAAGSPCGGRVDELDARPGPGSRAGPSGAARPPGDPGRAGGPSRRRPSPGGEPRPRGAPFQQQHARGTGLERGLGGHTVALNLAGPRTTRRLPGAPQSGTGGSPGSTRRSAGPLTAMSRSGIGRLRPGLDGPARRRQPSPAGGCGDDRGGYVRRARPPPG